MAIMMTGCSLFSARRPGADWQAKTAPDCNTGKGTVFLDGTMAVVLGIASLVAASEDGAVAALALVGAAAYAGSAGFGSSSANKCRAAIGEHEEYLEQLAVGPDTGWDDPPPTEPAPPGKPPAEATPMPREPTREPPREPTPKRDPERELELAREAAAEPEAEQDWASFWIEVSP